MGNIFIKKMSKNKKNMVIPNYAKEVLNKINNDPIFEKLETERKQKIMIEESFEQLQKTLDTLIKVVELNTAGLETVKKEFKENINETMLLRNEVTAATQMISELSLVVKNNKIDFEAKLFYIDGEIEILKANHCTPDQFARVLKMLNRAAEKDEDWKKIRKMILPEIIKYMIVFMAGVILSNFSKIFVFIGTLFNHTKGGTP